MSMIHALFLQVHTSALVCGEIALHIVRGHKRRQPACTPFILETEKYIVGK